MLSDLPDTDSDRRRLMVDVQLRNRGIYDERVLSVMADLPRHLFVPIEFRAESYLDQPVSIGYGQTISQPYIVALMSEKLSVCPDHTVLEIGTGCGYQTAVLAHLCRQVYTIECIKTLAERARDGLGSLGISNVSYQIGDGRAGWPSSSDVCFDRILVAAACESIPERLLDQLIDGGKMVLPVGGSGGQRLLLLEKSGGDVKETMLCYCRFVKLV